MHFGTPVDIITLPEALQKKMSVIIFCTEHILIMRNTHKVEIEVMS